MDPAHLITELRQHMARLRPVLAARNASPATFVQSDLEKCTMSSSVRTQRAGLRSPSTAAPTRLSRREKTLQLLVRGRPDRVKPAYILNGTDRGNNFNPTAAKTPAAAPPVTLSQPSTRTRRSGCHIHFLTRLNI
jgi:hypothetical protein